MRVDITNTDNKYQVIYADPPWKYGAQVELNGILLQNIMIQ